MRTTLSGERNILDVIIKRQVEGGIPLPGRCD
jgi:hypothetical protein